MEDYFKKIVILARAKYELDEDVIESYYDYIQQCYDSNYTPRRTLESIAQDLFKS